MQKNPFELAAQSEEILRTSVLCVLRSWFATTWEIVLPTSLLAQFNTHRCFSRNTSSHRAIPTSRLIDQVQQTPFVPIFHANDKGMKGTQELARSEYEKAIRLWLAAADNAMNYASLLASCNAHKENANRVLAPFTFSKVICTTSEAENFFKLRGSAEGKAQSELSIVADAMKVTMEQTSQVHMTSATAVHAPYCASLDADSMISAIAKTARVSYLRDTGTYTPKQDLQLVCKLAADGHWSPFEHFVFSDKLNKEVRLPGNLLGLQLRHILQAPNMLVKVRGFEQTYELAQELVEKIRQGA